MDTINTTTPPFITNTISESASDLINVRIEPEISTVFKIDDEIIFFFDEKVISGSGDIVISSDADTRRINIEDANQVSFDTLKLFSSIDLIGGSVQRAEIREFGTLVINPAIDLLPDMTYTIQVDNGAFADASGNALAGFNNIEVSTLIQRLTFCIMARLMALQISRLIKISFSFLMKPLSQVLEKLLSAVIRIRVPLILMMPVRSNLMVMVL